MTGLRPTAAHNPMTSKGMDVSSERLLLQRARDGHAGAFDQLFVQNKDSVYACLWHLLDEDADLVEEAVGNVFLNAYRALPRFRGDSSFSTWLYRIAINEARAMRTKKKRWQQIAGISLQEEVLRSQPSARDGDPAVDVARQEEERLLKEAVRHLPEPYKTPVVLRYFNGLAANEVAEILKRPAGTVRYQVSRGLSLLRERLGREG